MLLKQFKAALHQLQEYSDNELVMMDGISYSIPEMLKEIETKLEEEPTYFMFGERAIRELGQCAVPLSDKDFWAISYYGYDTCEWHIGDDISDLVSSADGWMGLSSIDKEEMEDIRRWESTSLDLNEIEFSDNPIIGIKDPEQGNRFFHSKEGFIAFVGAIYSENVDWDEVEEPVSYEQCKEYIQNHCPNLQLFQIIESKKLED